MYTYIALALNLIIVLSEIVSFSKIKKKTDIFKYYTYLQNLVVLVSSVIITVYLISNLIANIEIPEFVKGIRYIATCGLTTAMFIYIIFLSRQDLFKESDFSSNFSPKTANVLFHYACPLLSLVSFTIFERKLPLADPKWIIYASYLSCIYWGIYLFLSVARLWEEPYKFETDGKTTKAKILDKLAYVIIPTIFILISMVLWRSLGW